ncbi:PAS domain S-box protein [Natronorubrum texcoconense]|uniref:PAS domain S-box-containing protein n=1 Tax=Natronorubrum texcoconense TaxID=1095776 RepID=A0A1G9DTR0_9EURY|nr:PAS domain S-box protein [Natronorubrum texcoconense]SDK67232.1 PAS domain S-box-containing protein [Natronorubrum texcoconense]
MTRGLEVPEAVQVRVLAVGSSPWLQTSTSGLEDGDLAVDGPVEAVSELDAARLDAVDCVLTDDDAVLTSLGETHPVVYAIDAAACESIERFRSDGATDVIVKQRADDPECEPALLGHRLRQAAELAAVRRTASRQETWYQALLEQSSDLVVVTEADGTITYVGPSVEAVGGYDPESLVGNHVTETVHPEDTSTVRTAFEELREQAPGTSVSITYRCQHVDGSWYVHEADLTNRLADDDIGGIVASIRDITEHQQVEQELDDALERVTDAFCALDSDWRFTYVNERAATLLDTDPGEILGRKIHDQFPELRDTTFQTSAIEAMETQEPVSFERYYEPTDCWYNVRLFPSPSGISIYFTDVTDRIERESELRERTERLETLVQNVPVVLLVLDADGTITLAEGRALERFDRRSDDIVGESLFDVFEGHSQILDDATAALDGEAAHSSVRVKDRVFESWYRPIVDDGSTDRVIAIAADVTERAQYQEALNALHEATSHLLTVESKQAACEYIVDVAADVLDLESVVYRFDDQHNELLPAAYSQQFESTFGRPPRVSPDQSSVWQTFVNGAPSRLHDTPEADRCCEAAVTARSGLYVPIGEHGTLVALDPEPAQYDDDTFELAQLFATTAEAALDRISRTRRLHGRERELQQQNIHLERLNAASRVRQDIEQLLLMADSRAEIERGICDRLADLEACSFAWIGEPDPSGNRLETQASAGREREYLDAVSVTTVDDSAAEPTGRSARTREPTYVENAADSIRDGTWRVEALSRNYQSVYAVPLVYDGFLYGVLSIYGDDRDAFDEPLRETLAELGEPIGYAIDAVKRKVALRDDDVATAELELELTDESLLCRLASRLGTRVTFEGATIREDGPPTVFAVADAPVTAEQTTDLADIGGIHGVTVIAETEDETLLQLQCTEPFFGTVVDSHGGTLRSFVTDESTTRAIVDVPESIEIRDLLSGLNRRGFSVSMIARREQATADRSTIDASARNSLLEQLTDRQREVVQTAYHGGFFEWPRQTNGEEIADSLDISSPAFHKHVRAVEQKLFRTLFDEALSEG